MNTQNADRIEEIAQEIAGLVQEALALLPRDTAMHSRARSYWHSHILAATGTNNSDSWDPTMMQSAGQLREYGEE